MPSKTLWHSEAYKRLKYKKLCHSKVYFLPLFSSSAFHPRMTSIFYLFLLSSVDDEHFLSLFRFHPWMTDNFSRKSSIYYHIWAAFSGNLQFTIVFEQLFQKVDDLLPYLNDFSRFLHFAYERRMIFSIFWLSLVGESRFSLIFCFPKVGTAIFFRFFGFPKFGKGDYHCFSVFPTLGKYFLPIFDASFRTFYQLRETLRSNAYCYHTICRQ